jgi:acyl-coenzyme A synthetase/AMP-(fatty) acid ligase
VGIPDEYKGEVPLAYVVPSEKAVSKANLNPREVEKVKAEIMKVST